MSMVIAIHTFYSPKWLFGVHSIKILCKLCQKAINRTRFNPIPFISNLAEMNYIPFFQICSLKFSRKIKWLKSTLPSLIVRKTWLDWLTFMMLVFCGIQWSDTRMNWSTPILAFFVLPSIPTRGFQSTPNELWIYILVHVIYRNFEKMDY